MARDLIQIFDKVNAKYFNDAVCAGIRWHRSIIGKGMVTLGSCTTEERLIRINAIFQDLEIPLWYLEFIIYHEMIHALQGPREDHHNQEFLELEKLHANYDRAIEYELTTLPGILDRHRQKRKKVLDTPPEIGNTKEHE